MKQITRITNSVNDAALRVAVGLQVRAVTAGANSETNTEERNKAIATGWALSTPFALLFAAPAAFAAGKCGDKDALNTLAGLMGTIASFAIALGGGLVVVMVVFAGILWVSGKHGKAMERFKNALIGLAVMALGLVIKRVVVAVLDGGTSGGDLGGVSGCVDDADKKFGK